ncbi:hypothetical protein BJ165DRAFT_1531077 [Panaeolus papilionaceus]|nr:hypothetical protein BJ165DRAFT_1531077 [Panaeolus papilionaceus]
MPRVNYTDEAFKKVEQVVDRSRTTDSNINDDYVRQPPQNLDNPINPARKPKDGNPSNVTELNEQLTGVLENQETGRSKRADELASIAQDNSLHSMARTVDG